MASEIEYCELCLGKHITKEADNYCPQCDEKLCVDCTDHHVLSKATKAHQLLSISKYSQLPPFIRQIKQYCDEHGDILDFYCRSHDDVCCKRCMTLSHNHCKDVKVIEDLLKTSSSSTALDQFDKTLQDVESNIDIAMGSKENNLRELEKEKIYILKLVKEKKKEIISHLDELVRSFQQDLTDIEGKKRQQIGSCIQELAVKRGEANTMRKDIEMMKKHTSNVQIFLGTRKLEKPVLKLKKHLQSVSGNGGLTQTNIECKLNDQLLNLTKDVKSFGTISNTYKEATCNLCWQEEKAAQLLTVKQETIRNIILKKKQEINIKADRITGCTVMKDGSSLFTSQHILKGAVSKYNCNGQFVSEVKFDNSCAFDIVLVDDNTAVVTDGGYGQVLHFIDTYQLRKKNTINFGDDWSYGATNHDGDVISCTQKNGIGRISLSGAKYTQIIPTSNTYETYITSENNKLYHSERPTDSVVCYDLNGHKKWTYKDEVLNAPVGITIDSCSNVYVAGYVSNNVVVISPDGKQGKQLLGPSDGLQNPIAIFYDKERNNLLVTNNGGPAFLYAVS